MPLDLRVLWLKVKRFLDPLDHLDSMVLLDPLVFLELRENREPEVILVVMGKLASLDNVVTQD